MSTQDTYNLATGAGLIACPRCDALHIEEELSLGETARCIRCGGVLARPQGGAFTQIIALAFTTMVLVFAVSTGRSGLAVKSKLLKSDFQVLE